MLSNAELADVAADFGVTEEQVRRAVTQEAADLYQRTAGLRVAPHFFEGRVSGDWDSQLAHQTRDPGTREATLATITAAYGSVLGRG